MTPTEFLKHRKLTSQIYFMDGKKYVQSDLVKLLDDYASIRVAEHVTTKFIKLLLLLAITSGVILTMFFLSGCKTCEPVTIHDTTTVYKSNTIIDTSSNETAYFEAMVTCDSFYRPLINQMLTYNTGMQDSIMYLNGKLMLKYKGRTIYRTITDTVSKETVRQDPVIVDMWQEAERELAATKQQLKQAQTVTNRYRLSLFIIILAAGVYLYLKYRRVI